MRKILAALVILFPIFSGCGPDGPTPNDMADYVTQELRIPVFLWGRTDDACVVKQLSALYEEYNKATPARRAEISQKLSRRYSAIIVESSENFGTLERYSYEVRLPLEHSPKKFERRVIVETKQLPSWQDESGRTMGTKVEKAEMLKLTPVYARNISKIKAFEVSNQNVFSSLTTVEAINRARAIAPNGVRLVAERRIDPAYCGELLSFSDLF